MPNFKSKRTRLASVTERTFYAGLLQLIAEAGGAGVQEVQYNSAPDIEFDLLGRRWLLSVKIGENPKIIKDSFLQYLRHKEESGLTNGLLLLLPESIMATPATTEGVLLALREHRSTVVVDAGTIKEEYRQVVFPDALRLLKLQIGPLLDQGEAKHYPLSFVISVLRAQVIDVMDGLDLDEDALLKIVTDRQLLTDLASIDSTQANAVGTFLGAYIILSQILFLRLLAVVYPELINSKKVNHASLRTAFDRVLDINYRPIYELDVLDTVSEVYLRDTFDLIWGLQVEQVRYELPGRLFHELMPHQIRKLLAAFYTRPQAAELVAKLAISSPDALVFDPACGSGTILVAAYRRKKELHDKSRRAGNPHKRFCENELFGADIMPFAVHLTSANLAAMDVSTNIAHTQIIQSDAIHLVEDKPYQTSLQLGLFAPARRARTTKGEEFEVVLHKADAIVGNPPFTKVERGIRAYVDMERFKDLVGGEVGLWGHFIALADYFLSEGGMYSAVIPINILRGRESTKTRDIVFSNWTPLYVLKPTMNYGFSEWSEYRDVIIVARKQAPPKGHKVKFCLVKKDLTRLSDGEIQQAADLISSEPKVRSELLDIDSFGLPEVQAHKANLMFFCAGVSLDARDRKIGYIERHRSKLRKFDANRRREGVRCEQGMAKFLFLTRKSSTRADEAFLWFEDEDNESVKAQTKFKTAFEIERAVLSPSLRTPVGLKTMDLLGGYDYLATQPYEALPKVQRATGFSGVIGRDFWKTHHAAAGTTKTNLAITRRLNPYSPNSHLIAFYSDIPISPSDQLAAIRTASPDEAKALTVLFNSTLFFVQFFLSKEESTGRFLDVRSTDLSNLLLEPDRASVRKLIEIFDVFSRTEFPPLREQFDVHFDARYDQFWTKHRYGEQQAELFRVPSDVEPSDCRVNIDHAIADALGIKMDKMILQSIYGDLVSEMIMTRGLTKD